MLWWLSRAAWTNWEIADRVTVFTQTEFNGRYGPTPKAALDSIHLRHPVLRNYRELVWQKQPVGTCRILRARGISP